MGEQVECSAVYPTLAVPNVTACCNWYVEKLGFKIRFLWGEPPHHGAILLGEACVHFWEGEPQLGENWLYFDVDNVDGMYQRAVQSGVAISRTPENYGKVSIKSTKCFYIRGSYINSNKGY